MNTQDALQALETIEKTWREDRVRSDLLPAIQSLRQILWTQMQTQKPVAILHRFPSKGLLTIDYTDEITEVAEGTHNLCICPFER